MSQRVTTDVVIVGGGLAGLGAVATLAAEGRAVVLLEARDRLGGRVFTSGMHAGYPAELGAEWVADTGAVRAALAAAQAGLVEADGNFYTRSVDGTLVADEVRDPPMKELLRRIAALPDSDRSLDAALDEVAVEPSWLHARHELLGYVEGFHAADPADVSIRWLELVERNQPADAALFRATKGLDRGVQQIATSLGERCDIRLGAVVRAVRWQPGEVVLQVEAAALSTEVRARHAIITVPLGVLQRSVDGLGGIAFTPSLDSKREALGQLAMGSALKLLLHFDERFWADLDGLGDMLFVQRTDQVIPLWWSSNPVQSHSLVGWLGGPRAAAVALDDEALAHAATASLAACLDVDLGVVRRHLRAWEHHDWRRDPLALGAYSYVRVGGAVAHWVLAEPLEDTLFFAGEATAGEGFNGTMEGAYQSGVTAARRLLER